MTAPLAARPAVAFLDVNDTLSDLDSMSGAFVAAGLRGADVQTWYLQVLRDGFAATVLGDNPSYADIGTDIARSMIRAAHPARDAAAVDASAETVMRGVAAAQPHSDAVPGIVALAQTGVRVMTLSNGSADVARTLLHSSPAFGAVEKFLSVNDAGGWKPAPIAYRYGLDHAGVGPADAVMVAVHPWDLEGARRVGLRTAWINRSGAVYPALFAPPDFEATSFVDLAAQLEQATG